MSKYIPDELKERIKEKSDIVQIIGESLSLKKKGVNYIGNCPFHNEKTASFVVNPAKGIYKCFGCGAGGDVIQFVKENEKISYPEAIKYLAEKCHVELPTVEQTSEEKDREKKRETALLTLSEANNQFAINLPANKDAYSYLTKERELSAETMAEYQIGFARPDNQLEKTFPKIGHSFDGLMLAGLCAISDKGYQYDVFRSRITFPYLDLYGRPIGFCGRITDNDEKTAKYLNTGDTLLFNKGKALFGLFQAKKEITKLGFVYICEGQFDVVSMAQRGIRNIIAGSGTALTDDQARLIKRFTNTAVMLYDPDNAGIKACLRNVKVLLANGLEVKAILLPNGQDPDDFARAAKKADLAVLLKNREKSFVEYFAEAKNLKDANEQERTQLLDDLCDIISPIPDKFLKEQYARTLSALFETELNTIRQRSKPTAELKVEKWKNGFYGVEEAVELMKVQDETICSLCFSNKDFIERFSSSPTILAIGSPSTADIQTLRSKISKIEIKAEEIEIHEKESKAVLLLKKMHKLGLDISAKSEEKEAVSFCDYYISSHVAILDSIGDGTKKAQIMGRCADVIADLDPTVRVVMCDVYAKCLGTKPTTFKNILKPFLEKKKDKAAIDNQRLGEMSDVLNIDSEIVPDYVQNDKVLRDVYQKWGFYPLSDKNGRFCAYMFKNPSGSSHFPISDFYMKPLLHVYDADNDEANKRVLQLCHSIDKKLDRYVEWKSSTLTVLPKVHEKLVNEGAYNFWGKSEHYSKIWTQMSYAFTPCRPIRVFGQHPKGFFAFGNAVFHKVDDKYCVDQMDELGIVSHNNENFYSPAFSKIRLQEEDNRSFNQARNLVYKDIPQEQQLSFDDWASLMDRVYSVNDNGKWATLFAITCAFRDYIFDMRRYFTALFFIGPTSSGKSQIAESIRNLYMNDTTPSFNLNTGSDAGFFMVLESIMNVPVVMEEYNDRDISKAKFQGLKAATLDGEGKIKVKDVNSKQLDSSAINASIVLLGQEAAQQDDGALSNRCIMCDVPYRKGGDFTEEETVIFEKLKEHEKTGLSNILLQILELRPLYEKYFLSILSEETKKLKESVRTHATNTEGLTRILNACGLMTATCRLFEEHATHLKLPFTYDTFFPVAREKVLNQLERISSTNKLATFFQTISLLITHGKLKIDREIKIGTPTTIVKMLPGKIKEEVELSPDTKVLFLDFAPVYALYASSIGRDEALSQQSLKAYFDSNQAYLGLTSSTRFKWQEAEHALGSLHSIIDSNDNIQVDNSARMKMVSKTKNTSAYMFDYNILKQLVDIDFERKTEEDKENEEPIFTANNAAPF